MDKHAVGEARKAGKMSRVVWRELSFRLKAGWRRVLLTFSGVEAGNVGQLMVFFVVHRACDMQS